MKYLLRQSGPSADAANPTFSVVLDHPDVLIAGVFEQDTMFIGTEQRHAGSIQILFGEPGHPRIGTLISFGNANEHSARLGDTEDLTKVRGQVGPVIVRLHRGYQVKHAIGKRQLRDRFLTDLDVAARDCRRIISRRCRDTFVGAAETINLALTGGRRQHAYGSSAATAYIEDGVALPDGNMCQSPVG